MLSIRQSVKQDCREMVQFTVKLCSEVELKEIVDMYVCERVSVYVCMRESVRECAPVTKSISYEMTDA